MLACWSPSCPCVRHVCGGLQLRIHKGNSTRTKRKVFSPSSGRPAAASPWTPAGSPYPSDRLGSHWDEEEGRRKRQGRGRRGRRRRRRRGGGEEEEKENTVSWHVIE